MKKLLFLFSLASLTIYWTGCKKCFSCHNECTQCARVVSGHTFYKVVCRDSFPSQSQYEAVITTDTLSGYTCSAMAPTYNQDFCVNKPGEESYQAYYNHGGRATCTPK